MLPIPGLNTSKSPIRGAIRVASANGWALLIFGDSTWPSSTAKVSRLNARPVKVPVKCDFAMGRGRKRRTRGKRIRMIADAMVTSDNKLSDDR